MGTIKLQKKAELRSEFSIRSSCGHGINVVEMCTVQQTKVTKTIGTGNRFSPPVQFYYCLENASEDNKSAILQRSYV